MAHAAATQAHTTVSRQAPNKSPAPVSPYDRLHNPFT